MNPAAWDAAARTVSTPVHMHHIDHAYAHAPHHHAWPAAPPSHVDLGPKHYAADVSAFRPHLRHNPSASGDAAAHERSDSSQRPMPSGGAWRVLGDHSNGPPSLQVETKDLSRAHHEQPTAAQYQVAGGASTLLPSFASFQERTARNEEGDLIIAPMSQRLDCNMCTKLKPLVREIAAAVGDVDENMQSLFNKAVTRSSEFPSDSAVRTAQWILERLGSAKSELQARTQAVGYFPAQPSQNHLKRNADQWDRDDLPKRPRSGASLDQPYQLPSAITPRDERRPSMDYGSREAFQRGAYSPAPESLPGSAHPKQGSPMMSGRGIRALPSPSSMAYPPSVAPSLPAATAQSVGSPGTTYPTTSLHTVPTNSATSAHMADLQHQVTLKTLALQTLQTEYGSLLQKLQREKVKSQTIEKKTSVADQEVNELTSKNEELSDQVRLLEQQLEESDKKREAERAEAAKEKDQWSRMLEMGSRLTAQVSKDLQKIKEEKAYLLERIESLESQGPTRRSHPDASSDHPFGDHSTSKLTKSVTGLDGDHDQIGLRGEVVLLNARIETLRAALEEAQHHNHDLEDQVGVLAQRTGQIKNSITRVLHDDDTRTKTRAIENGSAGSANSQAPSADPRTAWSPPSKSMQPPRSSRGSTTSLSNTASSLERGSFSATTSGTTFSPGSADLGYDAATSSEEVIRSLGPLPAPPPKATYESTRYREGDAALSDSRYPHDPSYGHADSGPWTPTEHGHYWGSNDRLIQIKSGSQHSSTSVFRASPLPDSAYRAGSSPGLSSSPSSDAADETSSNASAPARPSVERYPGDLDLLPHSGTKVTFTANPHFHHTRYDGYPVQIMGSSRGDASYMLPPPRPA